MLDKKNAEARETDGRRMVSILTMPDAALAELLFRASRLGVGDAVRRVPAKRCAEVVAALLPDCVWLPADESLPLRNAYVAGYDLATARSAATLEAECFGMPSGWKVMGA